MSPCRCRHAVRKECHPKRSIAESWSSFRRSGLGARAIGNQLVNATATIFTDHAGLYGRLRLFAMADTDLVQAFEARLKLYSLDDRARTILAETWPVIEPGLDEAIAEIITVIRVLPRIGEIVAKNAELYEKLEAAHFRALLGGKLDGAYAESCRHTVLQEAAMGLDPRVRSTAGSYVLKAALDALARKHWFSGAKVAERGRVVSQAISFDVANAITLHRQAAEQASAARRGAIDDAIAEFAGAIGEVVEAIKEASGSLTTTCSTLNQVADATRGRMASASSASAETTQRMAATVAATEALSESIDEIGQQSTRGLGMAKSAARSEEH